MNQLKYRLPASTGISLLLHGLFLLTLQLYLQQHKPILPHYAEPLQARLVIIPPHKTRPLTDNKLLTTPAPSKFKIAQTLKNPDPAAPSPLTTKENAPSQPEHIAGIALPGAVPSPFSIPGVRVEGNAFFAERRAQQNAMQMYRERMQQDQSRQQREQQAQIRMKQLHELLLMLANSRPEISGMCTLIENPASPEHLLQCSSPALFELIEKQQNLIAASLKSTNGTSNQLNSFSISRNNPNNLIIFMNLKKQPE